TRRLAQLPAEESEPWLQSVEPLLRPCNQRRIAVVGQWRRGLRGYRLQSQQRIRMPGIRRSADRLQRNQNSRTTLTQWKHRYALAAGGKRHVNIAYNTRNH